MPEATGAGVKAIALRQCQLRPVVDNMTLIILTVNRGLNAIVEDIDRPPAQRHERFDMNE